MMWLLVAICVALPPQEVPPAIQNLLDARSSIVAGTIEWEYEDVSRLPGRVFKNRNAYAMNGDRTFERRGDQEGWVDYDFREGKPTTKFPHALLENEVGVWSYRATRAGVDLWLPTAEATRSGVNPPSGNTFKDFRWIATYPDSYVLFHFSESAARGDFSGDSSIAERLTPKEWKENRSAGVFEVSARLRDASVMTWLIDAERGWNATRITLKSSSGELVVELNAKLAQFGEVWFPREVEIRRGGSLFERFRIVNAQLNSPDAPAQLDPASIGIEPGCNIDLQNAETFRGVGPDAVLIWNGGAPVDFDTWKRQVASGDRQYGARFKRWQETGQPDTTYMTDEDLQRWQNRSIALPEQAARSAMLTGWEQYVAEFCSIYRLGDEQRQKAWLILDDCQKAGTEYLDRNKSEFAAAQRKSIKSRAVGDREGVNAAQAKIDELQAPLVAIFESQLKPRLEQLPTRTQRLAASQPASAPTTTTTPTRD